ncbi:MAG TPA: sulfurtransferase [Aquabacterium sp.]|nr:sulfurtransferase [Aquabacterium sp.]
MDQSPLISATDLARRLADLPLRGQTVVVDCRFNLADPQAGERAWQQGHIPGAHYAHLDRDLSGEKTGQNGRHPLPDPVAFARTVATWGVRHDTLVVAYDDAGGMFAARLWWMLRHWMGHRATAVLDGGWQHWLQIKGHQDTHAPSRAQATETWAVHPETLVTVDDVLQSLTTPDRMQLLDARAPDRFQGQNETLDPVGGHIPGALNRFFKENLQSNGCFKPAARLKEEFLAQLGTRPINRVVHQCGSGVTACHNLLAMEAAGLPGSRLYPGSWSEWCADSTRPMAR